MKSFLPEQEDKKLVIDAYDAIKKLAKRTTGCDVTDRKIYYIKYRHEGRDYDEQINYDRKLQQQANLAVAFFSHCFDFWAGAKYG